MDYVACLQPSQSRVEPYSWGFTPCWYACGPLALRNSVAHFRDDRISAIGAVTYQPRPKAWVYCDNFWYVGLKVRNISYRHRRMYTEDLLIRDTDHR